MTNKASLQNAKMLSLRIKRPHKKSTLGCITCKRRRVKCDEIRPCCNRCGLKRLECAYSEDRPTHSPRRPTIRDTEKASRTTRSRSPSSSPSETLPWTTKLRDPAGVPDTELAQHYLTHTVQSFADTSIREEQSNVWRVFIPALALNSPVVRRGVLTLAAICLHYDSVAADPGGHSLKYLEAAEAHGTIFVEESRQKLQDFHPSEFEHVLACSRLLCVLGFAFFRAHRRNGITLANRAAWTWIQLLRGVKTTYVANLKSSQDVDEIIVKDMIPELPSASHLCVPPAPRTGLSCKHPSFPFFRRSQRERFDALRTTLHGSWVSLGDQKTEDLGAAIDILYEVTEHVCSQKVHSLFRAVCTWPSEVPKGFVDMLMNGFPPALAVYAHWLMLVVLVENLWWVDDMGRTGIRDVIDMCSDASFHVRALLIWPQAMLDTGKNSTNHSNVGG